MAVVGAYVDVHGVITAPEGASPAPVGGSPASSLTTNGAASRGAGQSASHGAVQRDGAAVGGLPVQPANGYVHDRANGHMNGHLAAPKASPVPATIAPPAPETHVAAGAAFMLPLRGLTRIFDVETERHVEFVDVTEEVSRSVAESGVQHGFAVVFSRHTTAGIRINEHEPLLLEDMARLLDELAPTTTQYRHDDFTVRTVNLTENERINGHSHCRSLLLGASETVPVAGGKLLLGRWQRIFLVELDGPSQREFVVQVIGG
jgi:secondary thiamine-phosphate synthase enzyme